MKLTIKELTLQLRGFSEYLQRVGAELFQEAFRTQGIQNLTVQHLRYLELIEGSPGLSPGDLAETFKVTKPTVSNIIRRLEQQGLIEKENGVDDRRTWLLSPTERTRRIFEKRRDMYGKLAAHVTRALSEKEARQLVKLFGKITLEEENSHG
jgi:DNA-binding MarR family transcriptional regulator